MPGLKAFGRLWSVASDDFVFPSIIELVINCAWLLVVTVIYVTHDVRRTCLGGPALRTYVLGCCVQLMVAVPLLTLLAVCSGRGAVMETRRRRAVVPLLYCRLALVAVAFGWDVLGSVWLVEDVRHCDVTFVTVQIVIALVVCNWLHFVSVLVGVAVVFDPLGSVSLRRGGYNDACLRRSTLRRNLWQTRCRLLCCCINSGDTSEALRDIAGHIATLVGEVDLVPSDVVAGLILLQHRHARTPDPDPDPDPDEEIVFVSAKSSALGTATRRPGWMSRERAAHYVRHAVGVYGWPWFVQGRLCSALGVLCRRATCCATCRTRTVPAVGDNCCLCNTAALQECTGVDDDDFMYVSFVNKIYQVAFVVAVDQVAGSIVVAIRGTLSATDALTDLCLHSAAIDGPEDSQDRAHKGMLEAARYVLHTLRATDALNRAMDLYPEYDLVITGHSLGAGAAALLARFLRPTFPRLMCFAFSPPGGLVSRSVSEEMQQYVMSVVCGDDLVPRLSVAAVEKLKHELEQVLGECRLSKHTLLYRACCNCACGAHHNLVSGPDPEDPEPGPRRRLVSSAEHTNYVSLSDATQEAILADARAEHVPLYLPGHVLHVTTATTVSSAGGGGGESRWRGVDAFCTIRVTASMFADHLPNLVAAAVRAGAVPPPPEPRDGPRWAEHSLRRDSFGGATSGGEERPLFSTC